MEEQISSRFKEILKVRDLGNTKIYSVIGFDMKVYAIKVVKNLRKKELEILKKNLPLSCIKLQNDFEVEESHALVFNYYPSDIHSVLMTLKTSLPLPTFKKWTRQIAFTLNELHKLEIIHADIKTENILLTESVNNFMNADCILCDFGISAIDSLEYSMKGYGTETFVSPEVILHKAPTFASDVFSLGKLMIYMLINVDDKKIINSYNLEENKIKEFIDRTYPNIEKNREIANLIFRCIRANPEERITLNDFLRHSFFSDCPEEVYSERCFRDPQEELSGLFTEIKNRFAKFFIQLRSHKNKKLKKIMKSEFILLELIKYLAKKYAVLQLQDLMKICKNKLHIRHPLIQSIEDKIKQFELQNNSESYLDFSNIEKIKPLLANFIDFFKNKNTSTEGEKFVIMILDQIVDSYSKI